MPRPGLELQVTALLAATNARGGYPLSLVCTDQGLLVASAGEALASEVIAGFTSLFDDIVRRAERDVGLRRVDEVSLLDAARGRFVVRPLAIEGATRFFLVVQVPPSSTWRRNTNTLCRELAPHLAPLAANEELA